MLEKFDRWKRLPMWFWLASCTFPIKKRSPADLNAVYDAEIIRQGSAARDC
jgi:hypothetical protein